MSTMLAGTAASTRARDPVRPVNRQAERITGRTYLSHSQLYCMRTCPRKFAYQYVEKVPAAFVPSSLVFGGSIHSALELFFRAKLEGLAVTPQAMLSAYHGAWFRQKERDGEDLPVRFNRDETYDTLHQLAGRMIAAFLASPLASPRGTILGVEEELRVVLDPSVPDLLAKVDLVTQTDGALHVVDFKTSKGRWTEQKARESGEQLRLYGRTVSGMSQNLGVPVKLHFAVITKAKAPQVQLLPVTAGGSPDPSLVETVGQVWKAIQTGNFYPNPSPQNCTTCPFRSRCPVFAGS